jgi:hypothetical protein
MSIATTGAGVKNLAVGLAIMAGVGALAYVFTKGSKVVGAVATAVDPTNSNNIFNEGANAMLGLDNETASIGTKLYDGVQWVKGVLPFLESDAERAKRSEDEALLAMMPKAGAEVVNSWNRPY